MANEFKTPTWILEWAKKFTERSAGVKPDYPRYAYFPDGSVRIVQWRRPDESNSQTLDNASQNVDTESPE